MKEIEKQIRRILDEVHGHLSIQDTKLNAVIEKVDNIAREIKEMEYAK